MLAVGLLSSVARPADALLTENGSEVFVQLLTQTVAGLNGPSARRSRRLPS